jgi:predicted transcriptional regulator
MVAVRLTYFSMETTLTIRLSAKQREALKRRATVEKRSESALVRDLINRELQHGSSRGRI